MTLDTLLASHHEDIVQDALKNLGVIPLKSYSSSDPETNKMRFNKLLDVIIHTVESRNLIPMMEYSEKIARERYTMNFDIHEVQTAFNVLEEVIWEIIKQNIKPDEYPNAFGLISTIIGFGKETLAGTYITLLSNKSAKDKVDMEQLYAGVY